MQLQNESREHVSIVMQIELIKGSVTLCHFSFLVELKRKCAGDSRSAIFFKICGSAWLPEIIFSDYSSIFDGRTIKQDLIDRGVSHHVWYIIERRYKRRGQCLLLSQLRNARENRKQFALRLADANFIGKRLYLAPKLTTELSETNKRHKETW